MERDSFILYTEIREVIETLTLEQKGILFQAILDYASGIPINITDPIVNIAFIPIKQNLDRNNEKWEQKKIARSEAGKKGMRNRWHKGESEEDNKDNNVIPVIAEDNKDNNVIDVNNKNNNAYQDVTNITVNENVNVNGNGNVNGNVNVNEKKGEDKPRNVFKPPTLEEVKEYCWERNNGIDAQQFIDFYSSKGWMIGKNKMKDWKAAVRTWEQRNNKPAPTTSQGFFKVDDDFFRRKMGL